MLVYITEFGKIFIREIRIWDIVIRDIGRFTKFGKLGFGIMAFGILGVLGKGPVRDIGVREIRFGKR